MASFLDAARMQLLSPKVASTTPKGGNTVFTTPLSLRIARPTQGLPKSVAPINFKPKGEEDEKSWPKYRQPKNASYTLRDHCQIYFEERLYARALILWNNTLSAGGSYPTPPSPAFLPPPSHLAFTSTLLVHPTLNTKASTLEIVEISSLAYILLRSVLDIFGPLSANFAEAFTFINTANGSSRQSKRATERRIEEREADSVDSSILDSPLARQGSLWSCAQDFWHVVGWAFNCSVAHPKRWEYWRVWLQYMLELLEADLNERAKLDEVAHDKMKTPSRWYPQTSMQEKSIFMAYLAGNASSSRARRIVRAVFADGSSDSISAFPEVFEKETKERDSRAGDKRKRAELDIEAGDFGDYDEDDYGDASEQDDLAASVDEDSFKCSCGKKETAADRKFQVCCHKCNGWQHLSCVGLTRKEAQAESFTFTCQSCQSCEDEIGGEVDPAREDVNSRMRSSEVASLRRRLMALLSRTSFVFPDLFVDTRQLYNLFVESIKPLPLPIWIQYMSPNAEFPDSALSSLTQLSLIHLLPASAPIPDTNNDEINQEVLEECFLPFPASTSAISDNAKVSLLVETIFRMFISACPVDPTESLKAAIEDGILARETKIKTPDRRKKKGLDRKDEVAEKQVLRYSGKRLHSLIAVAEKRGSKVPKTLELVR